MKFYTMTAQVEQLTVLLEYFDLLQPKFRSHLEPPCPPVATPMTCYIDAHIDEHAYVYMFCMVKNGLPARAYLVMWVNKPCYPLSRIQG